MKHLILFLILAIGLMSCQSEQPHDVQVFPFPTEEQTTVSATAEATLVPTEEQATNTAAPEPTPIPTEIMDEQAILAEIETLVARREAELLSAPGWLYLKVHDYSTQDLGILPNGVPIPSDQFNESWYLINEDGQVSSSICAMASQENHVIQVSTFQNGISRNLTLGTEEEIAPYDIRLDLNFRDYAASLLTQGGTFERTEISSGDGRPAIQYIVYENHRSGFSQVATFDAESGALLGLALYETQNGEQALIWQVTVLAEQRAEQPPPAVLAYLGQGLNPYQPAPPQGILAPSGYDPSNDQLSFTFVNGDDPDQPSFFFGDIFAGGYLLGRVDFGAIPGGWCDRSPDGRRIAFTYATEQPDNSYYQTFRWYSLIDRQVFDPFTTLELRSEVTWAPDSIQLAFSATPDGNYEHRALYVYNTNTGELTRLAPEAAGPWHPHWSPDGNYVVSVVPSLENDNRATLYAVDVRSGEIYYQGPFDLENWQAAPDSPTHDWGVVIPNGLSGLDRCE